VRSEGGEDVSDFNNLPRRVKRQSAFRAYRCFSRSSAKEPASPNPGGGAMPPTVSALVKTGPNNYRRGLSKPFDFYIPTQGHHRP
jgi:hypothetical protein